jgi:hypothetical protein
MMKSAQISTAPWANVCYGIDAASELCVVIRAERRGRSINYRQIDFNRQKIEEDVVGGAAVAAGMPANQTIAAGITAPFSSFSKAAKVFPTLLDIQLPFPLEECLYDFTEIRSLTDDDHAPSAASKVGTYALAVAARKCDVGQRLTELENIGVNPHILDNEGIALWTQLLREHPPTSSDQDHDLKIIIFMRKSEGILVIGRGSEFRTYHRINAAKPTAVDRYLRVQLNNLGLDIKNGRSKINWFWAGTGFGPGEIGTKFKSHADQNWPGNSVILDNPETFLARALATRALLPGPMRINLRAGEHIHAGAQEHTRRVHRNSSIVILVAGLLLCAGALFYEYSIASKHRDFESAFSAGIRGITGYSVKAKGANALLIAERELQVRAQQQKPLLDVFSPSLLNNIQKVMTAISKYDIKPEQLKLTKEYLSIKAAAPTETAALNLSKDLAGMGYKTEITTGDSNDPEKYIFVLNAKQENLNE